MGKWPRTGTKETDKRRQCVPVARLVPSKGPLGSIKNVHGGGGSSPHLLHEQADSRDSLSGLLAVGAGVAALIHGGRTLHDDARI